MLRLLVVRSFRFTSYKFEKKSNLLVKTLTFLLVTVMLAKVRGFTLVIDWFSVFSDLAG